MFAAVPLPEGPRSEARRMIDDLGQRSWPVRWTDPGELHLTLRFFGDVAPELVPPIEGALRAAVSNMSPIPMTLTALGAFPNLRHARVVWVGLDAPSDLELLQHRIEQRVEPLGFPSDGKPFRPHVTLGRVREGARLPAAADRILGGHHQGASFLGDRVVLYESRAIKGRHQHHPLATLTLGEQ